MAPTPMEDARKWGDPLPREADIHTPLGGMFVWRLVALALILGLPGWWRLLALVPTILEFACLSALPKRIWFHGWYGGFGGRPR